MNPDHEPNTPDFVYKPPTSKQEANRLLDSILQLTAEMHALSTTREALRAKLLQLCFPSI